MESGSESSADTTPRRDAAQPPPGLADQAVHWEGLEATDEFRELVRRRFRFVLPATIFFLVYYFLLPLGNGLAPGLMKTRVIGQVNIAYLFALSEFVMAWVLAYLYIRKANGLFDSLAAKVRARAGKGA
ncbi:MAG: hypothetical protein QOG08_118 [Chloroflexota bacterium]|jgi:uncharacterized membrane protein (DUF485 family)|nr:hypothetical protein [Chloroflexota bacterium]